jgi:SagB-type dehydrogenase family enzyme
MTQEPPHRRDALFDPESPSLYPLHALYHEESKLGPRKATIFAERMEAFRVELEEGGPPPGTKSYPSRSAVELPVTRRPLRGKRLDDVVRSRRSHTGRFGETPVSLPDIAALLRLALGPTEDGARRPGPPRRASPSAGALYPLEAYLVALRCESLPANVYHYDPSRHALAPVAPCPSRDVLARLVMADDAVATAAAALVLTGVFGRTTSKYGERGYRFVLLEAGHAGQNVVLFAEERGLASVPVGGFFEDALGELLGLDARVESPVYVILLGHAP